MADEISKRLILIYVIVAIAIIQNSVDFQLSMFSYYTPPFTCVVNHNIAVNHRNIVISKDQCSYTMDNMTHPCQEWLFDKSQIKSTLVTDLNLICTNKIWQLIIVPIRDLAGLPIILVGFLADRFGRRTLFLTTSFLDSFFWLLIAVTPTVYTLHLVLRICKSMVAGSVTVGFVLVMELTPPKYKNFIAIKYWIWCGVGLTVAPGYIYLMQHWKEAWLVASVLNFYCIAAAFILLESPVWLMMHKEMKEAKKVLTVLHETDKDIKKSRAYSLKLELNSLLTSPKLVLRFFILIFSTLAFFLIYQGVATNLSFASSNIFISVFLLSVVEIPSDFVSSIFVAYMEPVTGMVSLGISGAICSISSPVYWSHAIRHSVIGQTVHTVLICLSKMLFISAWNIQKLVFVMLTPTSLRNFLFSLSDLAGIIGAALGAFVGYSFCSEISIRTTILIYAGILVLTMIFFVMVIPSTSNITLPNSVAEAKNIKKSMPFKGILLKCLRH